MGSIEALSAITGLNVDGLNALADVYAYIGAEFVRLSTSSPLGSVEGFGFLGTASLGMTLFGSMVYGFA
ncbi:hypothetical protein B2J88_26925 [Rhodococcus sp. SRB_17]|nr:hypothetical protein [Rhodococcus sp. SRB_17]